MKLCRAVLICLGVTVFFVNPLRATTFSNLWTSAQELVEQPMAGEAWARVSSAAQECRSERRQGLGPGQQQ